MVEFLELKDSKVSKWIFKEPLRPLWGYWDSILCRTRSNHVTWYEILNVPLVITSTEVNSSILGFLRISRSYRESGTQGLCNNITKPPKFLWPIVIVPIRNRHISRSRKIKIKEFSLSKPLDTSGKKLLMQIWQRRINLFQQSSYIEQKAIHTRNYPGAIFEGLSHSPQDSQVEPFTLQDSQPRSNPPSWW